MYVVTIQVTVALRGLKLSRGVTPQADERRAVGREDDRDRRG